MVLPQSAQAQTSFRLYNLSCAEQRGQFNGAMAGENGAKCGRDEIFSDEAS
jgi:hypothetical protein